MDIEKLIDNMDEEERILFLNSTASQYFYYVYEDSNSPLKRKIDKSDKLSEEEWKEILEKLFLVTTKALAEEEKIYILDSLYYLICKITSSISIKGGPFYNECVKYMNYLWGMRKEKNINKDLVFGYRIVEQSRQEQDLDILLRQHEEASIFRDAKGYYNQYYNTSTTGSISFDETIHSNSMKRSFNREKELTKKYYS